MKSTNKRLQVDRAKSRLLGLVAGASVVVVFSLVAAKAFYSQASYLNKVSVEKEKALRQLEENKESVDKLVKAYTDFSNQSPNLLGGTKAGSGERDGDNGRLVLDALPSKYDFPAIVTSMEKLLAGYSISSLSGTDDSVLQSQSAPDGEAIEIPLNISVVADYKKIQDLFIILERSIRPFQVTSIELNGTNDRLQSNLSLKTFYQPEKDLTIQTKVVE